MICHEQEGEEADTRRVGGRHKKGRRQAHEGEEAAARRVGGRKKKKRRQAD